MARSDAAAQAPGGALAASNGRTAMICAAVFVLMVGAAFAAVPLYRIYCQQTGFDGTTRRAEAAPTQILPQTIDVRFDTNVRGLPWSFTADQLSQTVHFGATSLAFFHVTNQGSQPVTGRAVFNVSPQTAGAYFSKLECFCFREQTLQPGQSMDFPVVYFVDPRFLSDPETRDMHTITLSYTFLPSVTPPDQRPRDAGSVTGLGEARRTGL